MLRPDQTASEKAGARSQCGRQLLRDVGGSPGVDASQSRTFSRSSYSGRSAPKVKQGETKIFQVSPFVLLSEVFTYEFFTKKRSHPLRDF